MQHKLRSHPQQSLQVPFLPVISCVVHIAMPARLVMRVSRFAGARFPWQMHADLYGGCRGVVRSLLWHADQKLS